MNGFDQLPASIEWMKNKNIRSRGCTGTDDAKKDRDNQRNCRGRSFVDASDD